MQSTFKDTINITSLSKVELSLLLILLAFGIPMIVLIPPGAGYDEEDHLVRVWELSAFSFLPGAMSPQELRYPTVFRDFAYRQQGSTGVIDAEFWQSYSRAALYERGFVRREIDTKSIYSPALLLPQAIAVRVFARGADLPTLPVFYLCRLANLLSYLTLIWLAIRLIPLGKWILLILAVSPMALFQAATISPDAISNGIGFLFIAGSLRFAKLEELGWRELGGLALLIFLLFLGKLNLVALVILPFLLIPPSRFAHKKLYGSLLAITLVLFLIEVAGWNWIASSSSSSMVTDQADISGQLLHILSDPFAFLIMLLKDPVINGWNYILGWTNGYGYYYWTPPLIVSLLYLLSLAFVLFMDSPSETRTGQFHVILVLVFATGYLATVLPLYTSFTPLGSEVILGVQGRYFVPLALLPCLALSGVLWRNKQTVRSPKWILVFLATALSLNLMGILFSFHVPCGSTFYQTGLCYRPLFRDLSSEARASQPLSNGSSLTQEIQVACSGLGEVRVLVAPSTTGDQGTTRFILENPLRNQTLLDESIPNEQVQAEDWYPLRFEPDWNSAGKQYILQILGDGTPTGQGLKFLFTPQPEFNLGDASENGQFIEQDIVLQYGCVNGLRKIWLTGRP